MVLVFCRKVFLGWLDLLWVLQALPVVGQQISWEVSYGLLKVESQHRKNFLRTDPEELKKRWLRKYIVSGSVMLDTGLSVKNFLFFWSSSFLFLQLHPGLEQRKTLWYLATWQAYTPSRKIQNIYSTAMCFRCTLHTYCLRYRRDKSLAPLGICAQNCPMSASCTLAIPAGKKWEHMQKPTTHPSQCCLQQWQWLEIGAKKAYKPTHFPFILPASTVHVFRVLKGTSQSPAFNVCVYNCCQWICPVCLKQ